MSTTIPAFITVTLPVTLPLLFAGSQKDVLFAIAKELNAELFELFFNHAAKILAHIFMISKPGATTGALNFIVELLSSVGNHGGQGRITTQSVVRGQIIDVVSEIVMKMGEEDPAAVQLVSIH